MKEQKYFKVLITHLLEADKAYSTNNKKVYFIKYIKFLNCLFTKTVYYFRAIFVFFTAESL